MYARMDAGMAETADEDSQERKARVMLVDFLALSTHPRTFS